MNKNDYERGQRAAWQQILGECIQQLGYETLEVSAVSWIKEREATVAALRSACEAHGDNDWPDDLHLADVIEKHLCRHLGD